MSKEQPLKDRALLAQMAATIAGGIGALNFLHNGRNVNEEAVVKASVSTARKILAELDGAKESAS